MCLFKLGMADRHNQPWLISFLSAKVEANASTSFMVLARIQVYGFKNHTYHLRRKFARP